MNTHTVLHRLNAFAVTLLTFAGATATIAQESVDIDSDDIGGVVTGADGPAAEVRR